MKETVITSSVLIIAVLILRTVFKGKISSRARYALWLIAALRLMLPFGFIESSVSVMNFAAGESAEISEIADEPEIFIPEAAKEEYIIPEVTYEPPREIISGSEFVPEKNEHEDEDIIPESKRKFTSEEIFKTVWFSVCAAMFIWFAAVNISFYIRLRKNRKPLEYDCPLKVYTVSRLRSPCIFGLFRPAVYVTEKAAEDEISLGFVIAHEYCHYRHGDMIWTVLRYALLAVYWFDPFVWLAAFLSKRDCECACDEAAIKRLGEENRFLYGKALVSMIPQKRGELFGNASTSMSSSGKALRERVKLIAKKPKNTLSAVICTVIAVVIAAGCTFTSARTASTERSPDDGRFILNFKAADHDRIVNEDGTIRLQTNGYALPDGKGGYTVHCDIEYWGNSLETDGAETTFDISGKFALSEEDADIPSPDLFPEKAQTAAFIRGEKQSFVFDVKKGKNGEYKVTGTLVMINRVDPEETYAYSVTEDTFFYYSNTASDALTTFARTYENYSGYYQSGAADVYLEDMSFSPDENGRFGAVSNLWIDYGTSNFYTIPLKFSRETESWYKVNEGRKVGYGNWHGTLLEDISFEDKARQSWESYVQANYPSAGSLETIEIYGEKTFFDEPVTEIYIRPVWFSEGNLMAEAGFVYVSEHYHMSTNLVYQPYDPTDSYGYYDPDREWVTPRGTGFPPRKNDAEFYEYLKTCTKANASGDELSAMKYRVGDTLYTFEKEVPAKRGYNTFRIDLVMTAENYPFGIPQDKNQLSGSFALRSYDKSGKLLYEQPVILPPKTEGGEMTVNSSRSWLSEYFKFSKEMDNLIIFSERQGYSYKALFFGINEKGEMFPYHIDAGEFPNGLNDKNDGVFVEDIISADSTQIAYDIPVKESGKNVYINYYSSSAADSIMLMYFDEETHTIKNFGTMREKRNEYAAEAAEKAMNIRFNILSLTASMPLKNPKKCIEPLDENGELGYYEVDKNIATDEDSLINYITDAFLEDYPIHDCNSEEDLRRKLFMEEVNTYGMDEGNFHPYFKMIDGKFCYLMDYRGASGTYTDKFVTLKNGDGTYTVLFVVYHVDSISFEGYTAIQCPDGKWRARDKAEITS